jgi:hypothetical protein
MEEDRKDAARVALSPIACTVEKNADIAFLVLQPVRGVAFSSGRAVREWVLCLPAPHSITL